jgi:ribosomal protein S16
MTWFKVDDKLHDHQKVRRAGKAAMGVWVMAGSWAADNLTDGFIPAAVLSRWGTTKDANQLVAAELWEPARRDGEDGWQFHDWGEYQPVKKQVEEQRKVNAERLRKWREKRRGEQDE